MLDFLKSKNKESTNAVPLSFWQKLKGSLNKTKDSISSAINRILKGKRELDAQTRSELRNILLAADCGVQTTDTILEKLATTNLPATGDLISVLSELLINQLQPFASRPDFKAARPWSGLFVGINGAGKTTSIGKLGHWLKEQQFSVLLAAGDTFRAAAIEQLQSLGAKADIGVIAQQPGADSAAVIFDALQAASARDIDVLLADTAGRLNTQSLLLDELKKVVRVMKKVHPLAPHAVFLVLDANCGQHGLRQVQEFHQAIGVTHLILTKLDGSGKGGSIFNITQSLKIPVAFIGLGEGLSDLKPFVAEEFVKALLNDPTTASE